MDWVSDDDNCEDGNNYAVCVKRKFMEKSINCK